jgi:hypothetical protein
MLWQVGVEAEESAMGSEAEGRDRHGLRSVYRLAMAGLVGALVVRELRLPAEERTWHGQVGGVVPYDLRMPTAARLKEQVWAPENPQLIVPRAFGVGWSLNVARVVALAREKFGTPS